MVFQLQCAVQKYAWGKSGEESEVAQLIRSVCPHFKIDSKQEYAELWMGTHPSGPSKIVGGAGLLKDWICENPESLGSKVQATFGNDLPFLFKVLSVDKALSIQAHPTKLHAQELHRRSPDRYPDANHKPEMAIALTPFEALCGFRPFSEIQTFVKAIPELRKLIGHQVAEQFLHMADDTETKCKMLKECFTALMTCSENEVSDLLATFVSRLSRGSEALPPAVDEVKDLVLRIHSQFPGDIGCFGMLFFNYIQLEPGMALFLAANEPHAYLYGDCIECMACSDNVVRAGLTPKFKDVSTLCDMLSYNSRTVTENLFLYVQDPNDPYCRIYDPPIEDFAVDRISVPSGKDNYFLPAKDSASILLIIKGKATAENISCRRGTVLFVRAGESLLFRVEQLEMLAFRAYTPL